MTTPTIVTASSFAGTPVAGVTAMVIRDDHIDAVGDAEQLHAQWPRAHVEDYGTACVLPGFNDSHMHFGMMVSQSLGVDLSPERTPDRADLSTRLAAAVPDTRGWVRAARYDHTRSTDGEIITRADLDQLVPDAPAVVGHISAHWGVVNSAALQRAGVTETTPDPDGGSYGRGADGSLTGQVSEQAFFDFVYPSLSRNLDLTPDIVGDQALNAVRDCARMLLAAGITSIGDAMMGADELRLFQRARAQQALPVRVNALMTFPHLPALRAAGICDGFGDDWLRIGGIKAFVDGAVAGRSCAVAEPFEGTDDRGILVTNLAAITSLAEACAEAGLTLAIHANGERAIELVLDA
ncbi:MAG: amidohydrolase, partial [Mycobacterium sp.]